MFKWHGGSQPGEVTLDGTSAVALNADGTELLTVQASGRTLVFRAAHTKSHADFGPSLAEWQAALIGAGANKM